MKTALSATALFAALSAPHITLLAGSEPRTTAIYALKTLHLADTVQSMLNSAGLPVGMASRFRRQGDKSLILSYSPFHYERAVGLVADWQRESGRSDIDFGQSALFSQQRNDSFQASIERADFQKGLALALKVSEGILSGSVTVTGLSGHIWYALMNDLERLSNEQSRSQAA